MARTHHSTASHQSETQSKTSTHKADHPASFESAAFHLQPQLTQDHLTPGVVMALQRTHGNMFVQRLVDSVRKNAPAVRQHPAGVGMIQREITDPDELKNKAEKLKTDSQQFYLSITADNPISKAIRAQVLALFPKDSVRAIIGKTTVPNADQLMDDYQKALDYLRNELSVYKGFSQAMTVTARMQGFKVGETQNKYVQELEKLTVKSIPHFSQIGELKREHERAEAAALKIANLRTAIDELIRNGVQACPTKSEKETLLAGIKELEDGKETLPKSAIDQKCAELNKLLGPLQVKQAELIDKASKQLKNRKDPDGVFYNSNTFKTLEKLLEEKKIGKGDFIGKPYRTNDDGLTGFSVATSVAGMKEYEIHTHCKFDGSIADGKNPVHIKIKGAKYDILHSVSIPAGDVRDQLLPSQEQRFALYRNSEIYVEPKKEPEAKEPEKVPV